jgi:hypothetical protein
MKIGWLACLAMLVACPAAAQKAKPLFETSDVIQVTVKGPVPAVVRSRSRDPVPAVLQTSTGETLPIALSARGLTRRMADTCDFPPLRVDFTRPPPPTSLFAGQRRLKLVTHCRNEGSFQQYVLLEYAAYRLYNVLTPMSFRVRLATVNYQQEDGRSVISRVGFFIEDTDDVAKRNGMNEIRASERIPIPTLSPTESARYALFQHMIANHDWSMRAGPAGDECCHNAKLIGRAGVAPGAVIPIPYDFDYSGFVNPPYAVPPEQLNIRSVRDRLYRGYCIHNREAAAVATQMRSARPQLQAALAAVPGLEPRTLGRASSYLDGFFGQIATDADTDSKVLKRCVG